MLVQQGSIFSTYWVLHGTTSNNCGVFGYGDIPVQVCAGQSVTLTS